MEQLPSLHTHNEKQDTSITELNKEYHKLKMISIIKDTNSSVTFNHYPMIKDLSSLHKSTSSALLQSKQKLFKYTGSRNKTKSGEGISSVKHKEPISKIDILYQFEKASIRIQRHWRGWSVRHRLKKYDKGKTKAKSFNYKLSPFITEYQNQQQQQQQQLTISDCSIYSFNSKDFSYSSDDIEDYLDFGEEDNDYGR